MDHHVKIEVFVPPAHVEVLIEAMHLAGAGKIGQYDHCVSKTKVLGNWRPLTGSNPYLGDENTLCEAEEIKIETRCSLVSLPHVVAAIKQAHPYEEPVVNIFSLIELPVKHEANEKIVFETERLIIRDHEGDDLEMLHTLLSDAKAMHYLEHMRTYTLEESLDNLKIALEHSVMAHRKKYYFAIIEKTTNQYLGEIGYDLIESNDRGHIYEMGYFLKPDFWGRGYATEAGSACVDYAFKNLNAHKIVMGCLIENVASEKVMIKLGFKKEGELKKHQYHHNAWKDRVIYGKLRDTWKD